MMMTKIRLGIWVALFVLLSSSTPLFANDGVEAITKPSEDITLSFVRPGQIAKVLAKEGQVVKPGQLLVQQDDAVERAQLAQLQAQADDTTRIKAAEAQLDQKKVDLQKIEWAAKRGAAAELEVEHTRLDVLIAELSLALTKFEHSQDARKFTEAKIRVSRMCLTSPIAGKVERIHVEAGESVDALEEVIRVVNINPLWIDVPVPLVQAKALKNGQVVSIKFAATDNATSASTIGRQESDKPTQTPGLDRTGVRIAEGKIVHVASVADAASNTLMVRVEVANPTDRPAGEHVRVSFIPLAKGANSGKVCEKASKSKSGSDTKESSSQSRHTGGVKKAKPHVVAYRNSME